MLTLPYEQLKSYRQKTFRLDPKDRLKTKEQAVEYVNERGFIHFWPIQNVVLPSLWVATAGDRPVPNEHDDPGHITWGWKDELLGKKVWYYARVLSKRNTIISIKSLPYFYALSPNYGDPDLDYIDQYEQGLMTQETKLVYEALLKEGPLDSISLRKAARLSSSESTSRFNRALDTLQFEFKALPVGISEAGAWRYSFVYDLTHHYFPDLIDTARPISEIAARNYLLKTYLCSVGAASIRNIQKLFAWRPEETQRTIRALVDENFAIGEVEISDLQGKYLTLTRFA